MLLYFTMYFCTFIVRHPIPIWSQSRAEDQLYSLHLIYPKEVLISTVLVLLQVIINNLVPFPFFAVSKVFQATVNRAWSLKHSLSAKVNSDPGWLKIDIKNRALLWKIQKLFLKIFLRGFFFLLYSALLYLPPLRFHCADGCWDQTQDSCNWCIGSQTL